MASHLLLLFLTCSVAAASDPIDKTWQQYLDTPPQKALNLTAALESRADATAAALLANLSATGMTLFIQTPFDVVCSGGGDLDAYYIGIEQIFRRVKASNGTSLLDVRRHAGASAGGWISFENKQDYGIVTEGDTDLFNQYGVIPVNPAVCPNVNATGAQAFADWLLSDAGQTAIAEYKIDGQQLFFPNAPKG